MQKQTDSPVYIVSEQDGHQLYLRRKNTGYEDGKQSLLVAHIKKVRRPINER